MPTAHRCTHVALLAARFAFAQNPPALPSFDVVSIKAAPNIHEPGPTVRCTYGHLSSAGFPVWFLIRWSYDLPPNRIFGLPDWAMDWDNSLQIEARSEAAVTIDQCKLMAQQMLAERFRMKAHSEERKMRGYALTLKDDGKKLRESTVKRAGSSATMNGQPLKGQEGLTIAELAAYLGAHPRVGQPVVDQTGLDGRFIFALDFSLRDDDGRPSVATALSELGLKLQDTSLALPVLVVDHIERPGEN